ncbi:hypothetical protein PVAND_013623 [Polypedilum vanderplanki]|uniref:Uncharacterized protein n=1 Tax=Polypedilum vanderplanki TaxID=319348 RepID=A0A9J6CR83_POLVA|nr:hypothetical protein PVAND_013623 [Polypedilum vanderplanki]
MEYKRMKDEQNILSSPDHPDHHHHNHHHRGHDHHRHHKKSFCLIAGVMTFVIVISYIIIVGASFGIHQKNSLIHGNYILNSSIIINIIVNGRNKTLDDEDNAMIFRIIEEVIEDESVSDDVDEETFSGESEEKDKDKNETPFEYEEIDKTIPISKGPLKIENPEKIPLLNQWKASEN